MYWYLGLFVLKMVFVVFGNGADVTAVQMLLLFRWSPNSLSYFCLLVGDGLVKPEALNKKAIQIINRVRDKLTGEHVFMSIKDKHKIWWDGSALLLVSVFRVNPWILHTLIKWMRPFSSFCLTPKYWCLQLDTKEPDLKSTEVFVTKQTSCFAYLSLLVEAEFLLSLLYS